MFGDLRELLLELKKRKDIIEINIEVDPKLELAEIHRRVIESGGPALLFKNVKGSKIPVLTNIFGTEERTELAFGSRGEDLISEVANFPHKLLPPTFERLWDERKTLIELIKIGTKISNNAPVLENKIEIPDLESLPVITSWKEDGGPFFTLPLVYTEDPDLKIPNLGMYRLQRFSKDQTGLHMQIGKGGGFHLKKALERKENLPVNVFLGGPPAAILAAIAPLPENVPELLLASLILGKKLKMTRDSSTTLPILAEAEIALIGECNPQILKPEGPFGDHYGYYSLVHDFPVFECKKILKRKDAIYPATVVGKPKQEDFFIGEKLQKILSPLFPIVMPGVKDLWSYGETGFHSLSAAVVQERYKREAMANAFRILGEGQLSLTKFLLAIDKTLDLKDFKSVFTYILERADFRTDLYIFSNLSMDTLDYAGPALNEGSKGVLLGMGEKKRELPSTYNGNCPSYLRKINVFSPGVLVVEGENFKENPKLAHLIAKEENFNNWPFIVISDNADFCSSSSANFLWSTFTRFDPAQDIYGKEQIINSYHVGLTPPITLDARMKPRYPDELECDENTKKLVDSKWGKYF